MRPPLQIPKDRWHSRWLVLPSWERLHRVAAIEWDDDDMIGGGGVGVTVCGRKGRLVIPGIFSRMGMPRCAHCCKGTGVPRGDGAPVNHGIEEVSPQ